MTANSHLLGLTSPSKHALYQAIAVLGLGAKTSNIISASRSQLAALNHRQKVLCIGSGIAGLVAGYELHRLGVSFELHEARPTVGGRCETIRGGDVVREVMGEASIEQYCQFDDEEHLYFNSGPSRIPSHHANILAYCEELGLRMEPFISENSGALAKTEGPYGCPAPDPRLTELMHSHLMVLAHKAAASSQSALSLEDQNGICRLATLLSELSSYLDYDDLPAALRPGATFAHIEQPRALLATIALEEIARLDWQHFIQLLAHHNQYDQASKRQAAGGMDRIVKALAAPIREHIATSSALIKVKRLASGKVQALVKQRGEIVSKEADAIIFTMQPTVLRTIDHDFSDEIAEALKAVHIFPSAKVAFEAERFWQNEPQLAGGWWTDDEISNVWFPSHGKDQPTGVLTGAYNLGLDPKSDFNRRSPLQRIEAAKAQGNRLFEGYDRIVSKGVSRSWPLTPYIGGGFAAIRADELLLERHGPYIFAGDYTTYWPGWQEGAVLSAHRAIRLLGFDCKPI